MKSSRSVIIVGAGLAGIAAATRLAQNGIRVTVFEKNPRPGGRCDRFSRDGHHFDTGPTLYIMPDVYRAEFAALGVVVDDLLDLQRLDPTYRLIFDDGSQLGLTSDLDSMSEQVESIEPGSAARLLRYLDEGKRHYDLAMPKLVNRDFRSIFDLVNLENLPMLFRVQPFAKHYRHMSAFFSEPRLKSAFTFQDVYMGLSPFEAPATFSMMPYIELADGVWYPRGGMYGIVSALMGLAQNAGVEFEFDTPVHEIQVNGRRARGVITESGRNLPCDAVLANADLPYVYQQLLPADGEAARLSGKRFSCSVTSFFWAVDRQYASLGPHTLFLVDDYRANFDAITRDLTVPDNPSIYIHAPARLDAGMAPPGEDTLIAIVPVGHLDENGGGDWKNLIASARESVFKKLAILGITDLKDHIKFETCYTPLSWNKRYNLLKGATHGLSHNLTQLAYFRPANRHARYHNIYFAGASTRPGTGMPTALISARLAAQRILEDLS